MAKAAKWQVPFFTIWTGQAFSLIGSQVAQFALVWWLTETTGSATVLATATMVALLPQIVLGPFAGALVDRWDRRVVMMVADGFVALASLWLAYLMWAGRLEVWHIYVLMLARSIGSGFHWPAMQASTSLMVPKEHLTRVGGLNQTMNGFLNVFGPPLGALLMAWLPLHGVMLIDVGTALLAIVPLFFVRIPQPERAPEAEQRSVWGDLREGFHYVIGWPGLLAMVGLAMLFKIALTPAFSLMSLLVVEHFGGGAAEFSALEAAIGVGMLVGGLVLSVWGGFKRRIVTTLLGMAVFGVCFATVGLMPPGLFWAATGLMFVGGAMISMIDGPIGAILQATVSPELQGRVMMLIGSLLWITSPVSLALAGPITDWLGLQVWYVAAGVLCVVAGVVGLMTPEILNIEGRRDARDVTSSPVAAVGVTVPVEVE